MRLFIRIRNGRPFGNPILEENFVESFPGIDINDPPEGFEECFKSAEPSLSPYEILEATYYDWDVNRVVEKFKIRLMTDDEKKEKQDSIKAKWLEDNGYASWVFDEILCRFIPPVPYPSDNAAYVWNEETLSWVWVGPATPSSV